MRLTLNFRGFLKPRSIWSVALTVAITSTAISAFAQAPAAPGSTTGLDRAPLLINQVQVKQRGLGEEKVSVFLKEGDLRELLLSLGREMRRNIVLDSGVQGTVSVNLYDVTLRQVLDQMVRPLGYDYRIMDDGLIRVTLPQMETRTFYLNYVITQRRGSRNLSSAGAGSSGGGGAGSTGSSSGSGLGGSHANVTGTEETDIFAEIEEGLNTMKSQRGKVVINRQAGILTVEDMSANLDRIGRYLNLVQAAVSRQVLIEARLVEVVLSESSAFGINWTAVFGNGDVRVQQRVNPVTASGNFQVNVDIADGDFSMLLDALKTQGDVEVLSSPRILALNNQPAMIRVGTNDVFFTTTSVVDSVTGRVLQTSVFPQSISTGVTLSIISQIAEDGNLILNITPSLVVRTGQATSRFGDVVPIVDVRSLDTVVRIKEGNTVAIGGLMDDELRKTISKVPGLGDIPVLGRLFRRTASDTRKSDLVILLSARVVDTSELEQIRREEMERLLRLQSGVGTQ